MRSIDRQRSSLNPNFCNACEDFARQHPSGAVVEMSILFADVRGSTLLSEQMTASEFQKLINRFYVGATHVIAEQDGFVEKLAGDAVATFWGFADKNYVSKTVRAARLASKAAAGSDGWQQIGITQAVTQRDQRADAGTCHSDPIDERLLSVLFPAPNTGTSIHHSSKQETGSRQSLLH